MSGSEPDESLDLQPMRGFVNGERTTIWVKRGQPPSPRLVPEPLDSSEEEDAGLSNPETLQPLFVVDTDDLNNQRPGRFDLPLGTGDLQVDLPDSVNELKATYTANMRYASRKEFRLIGIDAVDMERLAPVAAQMRHLL